MPAETTVKPEEQAAVQTKYRNGFHDAMEKVQPLDPGDYPNVWPGILSSVNAHIHRSRATLHAAGENARRGAAAALDLGQTDKENGEQIAAI